MEIVTVTITTDVPVSVKVIKSGSEPSGYARLLDGIKNVRVSENESQRKDNARNYEG
jgi:hypothetical protein